MNGAVKLYVLAPEFLVAMLSFLLVCGAWRIRRTGELRDFGKEETLPFRAILALFVIVGHLDSDTKHAFPFLSIFHWSTPAVAVFFFMSGFGLRKVYEGFLEQGGLGRYLVWFPWRTTVRLLPPFLVLGPVYAIWKCCVGRITPGALAAKTMNLSILDIPHDWYVIALAILYAFDELKRVKALCFLGLFSYEIYLIHGIFEKMFLHAGMGGLPYVAAVFAVSIPAAWLLWKFDSFVAKFITCCGQGTVRRGEISEVCR